MKKEKKQTKNIYETITSYFVETLKEGRIPWTKPFESGTSAYISHLTGRNYSWLNCMLLAMQGAPTGEYMTYKQAENEGGNVRRGAKSKLVTFYTTGYDKYVKETVVDEETGEEKVVRTNEKIHRTYDTPVLVGHRIFSVADDIEGIKPKYYVAPTEHDYMPVERVDNILADYRTRNHITLKEQNGTPCCYKDAFDDIYISIPPLKYAISLEEYYSTMFHETIHSTGHLLGRDLTGKFGSKRYASEELCTEIGASFLMAAMGLDYEKTIHNSAAYINSWITRLESDPKLIAVAAALAEKGVKLIMGETNSIN